MDIISFVLFDSEFKTVAWQVSVPRLVMRMMRVRMRTHIKAPLNPVVNTNMATSLT
jgi:hypothetical protein